MESHTIVDQWGMAYCCISQYQGKMCGSEEFFMMDPPDEMWEPQLFCAQCRNTGHNLTYAHIYHGINGARIPEERKVSELERIRRQIVEDGQAIDRLRLEYSKTSSNLIDGRVKTMKLEMIKEQGEFRQEMMSEQTAYLRKRLIHG